MTLTEYGPTEFVLQLTDGAGVILPWIGAGVGAGVLLLLIFLGIRQGVAFFSNLANERAWDGQSDSIDSDWHPSNSYEAYEAGGRDGMDAYNKGEKYDYASSPWDEDK